MNDTPDPRIVAAFDAGEKAITETLAKGGTWGPADAVAVVSLIVTRFACGVATLLEGERGVGETDLKFALDFVEMVSVAAKRGCQQVFKEDLH